MLDRLLTAPRALDLDWEALREPPGPTAVRAVLGGARTDRVGFAFAIGYAMAIEALTGDTSAALCVTEDAGNHPRAIRTQLVDGRVTGSKKWATMADRVRHLLVAANEGDDAAGRPRIRVVRVRTDAPGIAFASSAAEIVPEVSHARVTLDAVPGDVLPGDGYSDYVKPFRTIEDIHVHGALIGYALGAARTRGFSPSLIERLAMLAAAFTTLGSSDPKSAATHVALGGALATGAALIGELEAAWAVGPDDEWQRWQRDRMLLQVAGKARAERLARAWATLTAG